MKIHIRKLLAILLLSSFGILGLTACDDQGPAEELGEEVDEAAQDAGRSIEDAAD